MISKTRKYKIPIIFALIIALIIIFLNFKRIDIFTHKLYYGDPSEKYIEYRLNLFINNDNYYDTHYIDNLIKNGGIYSCYAYAQLWKYIVTNRYKFNLFSISAEKQTIVNNILKIGYRSYWEYYRNMPSDLIEKADQFYDDFGDKRLNDGWIKWRDSYRQNFGAQSHPPLPN